MRTDSVNLSQLAINTAKKVISETIGEKYVHSRQYKTKTKGAQEAHEAIRPTYLENETISGTSQEKRLYDLIWKRAVASQMSDAELEKTTVTIHVSTAGEKFVATGEVLRFDGFLRVYMESNDDENSDEQEEKLLPPLAIGDALSCDRIDAVERFSLRPPRYTEASLVRKLEELGIGRPSTYAPIITTVQQRGYVVKEDRDGAERNYKTIGLKGNTIKEDVRKEVFGTERSKLFPTDIGIVVNDYLIHNFEQVMDFNFTAKVEKQFDEIAEGHLIWNDMIDEFYKPFHKTVEKALNSDRVNSERVLGTDPVSGKRISGKIGKFGPLVQLGEKGENETDEKPRFASLNPGMSIETITLEEAFKLFSLPRELGEYEEKKITVAIGRFGPYVRFDNKFVSLQKDVDDPYTIARERAIELIEAKREKDRNAVILLFEEEPELRVLNGRWGPYISYKKENYKIPKETDPHALSLDDCKKLIADSANAPRRNGRKTRKTTGKGK
jgi:DNA topoisomerase-1